MPEPEIRKFNFVDTTLPKVEEILGSAVENGEVALAIEQINHLANAICPGNEEFWGRWSNANLPLDAAIKNVRDFSNSFRKLPREAMENVEHLQLIRLQIALLFSGKTEEIRAAKRLNLLDKATKTKVRTHTKGIGYIPWHEIISLEGYHVSERALHLDAAKKIKSGDWDTLVEEILAIPPPSGNKIAFRNIIAQIEASDNYEFLKAIFSRHKDIKIEIEEFAAIRKEIIALLRYLGVSNI